MKDITEKIMSYILAGMNIFAVIMTVFIIGCFIYSHIF